MTMTTTAPVTTPAPPPHPAASSCGESSPPFERIRRITGYLVGTTDRFNDGKKAEERDRIHHTVGRSVDLQKHAVGGELSQCLRLAGVVVESTVDGPGFRLAVFAQGCPHRCPRCHNPATHDFEGGVVVAVSSVIEMLTADPMHSGLSLSGGEPFMQARAFSHLAWCAGSLGYDVMAWTGYTFEELYAGLDEHPDWRRLLDTIDVLVDGPYIEELRSLELQYRGSANQRVLDVPKSLAAGAPVLAAWAYETR